MAKRCNSTNDLEVHHKRVDGGNDLDNAEVLCQACHSKTSSYGRQGHQTPPAFSQATKDAAMKRAGNKCECTREDCH